MPIDKKTSQVIESKYNDACELLDNNEYTEVISLIEEALELIPEPKVGYEESLLLYIIMADTYYYLDDSDNALKYFYKASNCPNGFQHPFINMRLGQVYFEFQLIERCKEYLLRAHMVADKEIFENEDPVFLEILEDALEEEYEQDLDDRISDQIEQLVVDSSHQWRQGNYTDAIKLLESAWNLLPSNKLDYLESYIIACGFIENSISLKDEELLKNWYEILLKAAPNFDFNGEREFVAGKAAYELEDYNSALNFFCIADRNDNEISFQIGEEKYEEFYLSRTLKKTNLS